MGSCIYRFPFLSRTSWPLYRGLSLYKCHGFLPLSWGHRCVTQTHVNKHISWSLNDLQYQKEFTWRVWEPLSWRQTLKVTQTSLNNVLNRQDSDCGLISWKEFLTSLFSTKLFLSWYLWGLEGKRKISASNMYVALALTSLLSLRRKRSQIRIPGSSRPELSLQDWVGFPDGFICPRFMKVINQSYGRALI